ncbi:hypothetical protein SA51_2313 [Salmonella enterica subsp. enterica serovar Agona str. 51.E.09]|nr:hypothetical protein SA51_2313 [Salmonella enterica subsp. enterica serovar Agona str. 51.E.09]
MTGLSPLARGTPLLHRYAQTTQRFIPAGAGNTAPAGSCPGRCAVYPR